MRKTIKTIIGEDNDFFYESFAIKKKSGKLRQIIAPSPKLKRYSRAAMHKLNWHFKNQAIKSNVLQNFHGFVPKRNAVTAAKFHIGYETTIMFDLVNFFDTVKRDMFDEFTFEALEIDSDYLFHKKGYAAQGFPSSPTLANLALIDLVREFKEFLSMKFGKEGEDWVFTLYADDLQISFNDTKKETWQLVRDQLTQVVASFGFEINQNKTRVRFAKYGWRKILGLNVGPDSVRATRRTMKKLRAVSHKAKLGLPRETGNYGQVKGGIKTWSLCLLPKKG